MLLSLLTPLFGVLFGALLLADPVSLRFALGAALVLTGVLIVNLQVMLKRRPGSAPGTSGRVPTRGEISNVGAIRRAEES